MLIYTEKKKTYKQKGKEQQYNKNGKGEQRIIRFKNLRILKVGFVTIPPSVRPFDFEVCKALQIAT